MSGRCGTCAILMDVVKYLVNRSMHLGGKAAGDGDAGIENA
jgi:hypothetical protein